MVFVLVSYGYTSTVPAFMNVHRFLVLWPDLCRCMATVTVTIFSKMVSERKVGAFMQGGNTRNASYAIDQIPAGATVYDSSGDKVGTVIASESTANYLMVEKGWLFPQDVYVPLDAIKSVDANNVYLAYTKDEMKAHDWTTPPVAGSFANDQTLSNTTTSATTTRATDANIIASAPTMAASTTTTSPQDINVQLREEELVAGKRQVEEGNIHLSKDVVAQQQTINVPVSHEEVILDRHTVDRPLSANDTDAFVDRDIDVPVMGEEVVTGKQARVAEEVHLHKQTVTEQQQVTDTVRKEQLHVEDSAGLLTQHETGIDQTNTQR